VPIRSTEEQEIVLGVTRSSIYKTFWNTFYQYVRVSKVLCLHQKVKHRQKAKLAQFFIKQHAIKTHIIIMAVQPFVGPWPCFQFLNPVHSR
jgi:hypothetical protein